MKIWFANRRKKWKISNNKEKFVKYARLAIKHITKPEIPIKSNDPIRTYVPVESYFRIKYEELPEKIPHFEVNYCPKYTIYQHVKVKSI